MPSVRLSRRDSQSMSSSSSEMSCRSNSSGAVVLIVKPGAVGAVEIGGGAALAIRGLLFGLTFLPLWRRFNYPQRNSKVKPNKVTISASDENERVCGSVRGVTTPANSE